MEIILIVLLSTLNIKDFLTDKYLITVKKITTMKITINNNARVFLISRKGFFTRTYFCNLEHIPNILKNELEPNDEYTISEYWNFHFKRIGKKALNEMFAANKVDFKL